MFDEHQRGSLLRSERLAAAFPHGRFELVDDSATFIPCDQPHSLAAILTGFLAPDAAR
jgi:hypothetical protein